MSNGQPTSGVAPSDEASAVQGRVLELFELDESAVHELASKVLDDEPVSSALGHRLWAVSRGNPLLAEEALLSLRADGLVSVRDGRWRAVEGLDDLDRFRGIERIIIERLDRLGPSEKLVLKLASVVGTRFQARELRELVAGSELGAPLDGVLSALRARHLIEPAGEHGQWQFRHDRTREVIYDTLPGTLRRELHLAVATCLEQHPEWGPWRRADVLARHFHAAGVVEKALFWADRAAGDAIESGAFKEAVTSLQICLEHEAHLTGRDARLERVRWRRQLAAASLRLGDLEQVKTAVESALALSGRTAAQGWLARGGRLARALSKLAARELRPVPSEVLAPSAEKAWALELARTHILENMLRYYEHDLIGCAEAVFAATDWAERAGPCGELVEAYSLLGAIVGLGHRERLAAHFFGRATAMAARLGDRAREAAALMTQGLYHVSMGHWGEAASCVDASQERATSVGDSLTWCHAQQVRFWLMHYQGQRGMAEETARELFARAQNSGNLQQEIWALRNKALCALARDSPQLARDYLRLALKTVRGRADKSELLQSTGCLALAYARTGGRAQALEAARTTIGYLTSVRRPTVHSALEATSAVVEVYLRGYEQGMGHGDASSPPPSEPLVQKALDALELHAKTFPTGQPRLALWRGLEAWLSGKPPRAIERWERGLERARALGMPGEVALLEAELRSHRG
jgi:tetratricopeptide (TPR) repeat protein